MTTPGPVRPVLVALLLGPLSSAAQTGGLPKVLELPASTRAMALGDAFMMDSGSSDALFYHPALVADASGFGLDVQRWRGPSTSAAASASVSWLGGGVAVGLQTLQYSLPADTPVPSGQDHLFADGSAQASERVATVGYGRRLFGLTFGVAGKLAEQRVNAERDAVALVDLGAAAELGPVTVGLSLRDWGSRPSVELGGANPTRLVIGAGAYGHELGPLDVGLAGSFSQSADRTVASAGVEVGYWPVRGRTFVGRVGLQSVPEGEGSPVSVGLAFWGDDLVLEWAYRAFAGAGTHRFGVRFQ
jgi:hypothetical protein